MFLIFLAASEIGYLLPLVSHAAASPAAATIVAAAAAAATAAAVAATALSSRPSEW